MMVHVGGCMLPSARVERQAIERQWNVLVGRVRIEIGVPKSRFRVGESQMIHHEGSKHTKITHSVL